jgi:hypothetical protein
VPTATANTVRAIVQASQRRRPVSCQGHSKWHLWLRKLHWDRVFSELFCFPVSAPFHFSATFTHILSEGCKLARYRPQLHRDIASPHHNSNNDIRQRFKNCGTTLTSTLLPSYLLLCDWVAVIKMFPTQSCN